MASSDGDPAEGKATVFVWSFGPAEFDESRWRLLVGGQEVELERKPLEVLQYLLRHAGELVTKEELLASAWTGRVVVEAALTNAIGKLRRALADDEQQVVVTIPRVGYRLSVPVSRKPAAFLPVASRLSAGSAVPRRPNWQLAEPLARTAGNEVWLAMHAKTREARVFKFSLAGDGLHGLKREVTVARLLREALGERPDFVHVLDWDFEQAPYFVESEYGGTSLDRWPDGGIAGVPLETRLELFVQAAEAVAAAHGVGVLHKDLKPANLLVAGDVDSPQLRVADFGSSRVFDAGVLEELGITRLGLTQTQVLPAETTGTPLYLAPEVVAGQAPSIASDVYALGVTLYQLVVGDFRRPLAPGWESDIGDELLRRDIAAAANGDPARRPASVAELAGRIRDLGARRDALALERAVQARIAEGERKLARARARRPWMVVALLLLLCGLAGTTWSWQRSLDSERLASAARDRAEREAGRAEAVVRFLSDDLIRSVAPEGKGYEKDPTIREMLEYASARMEGSFQGDAATRGSLHAAIAASWGALFDRARSIEHYRLAAQAYAQAFGASDELTLRTRYDLARQLAMADAFEEARELLATTDQLAGSRLQAEGELALWSAWSKGTLAGQQLDPDEAERALRKAAELQPKVAPKDAAMARDIRLNLAGTLQRQGKFTEMVAMLRAALAEPALDGEETRNAYRSLLAKILTFQNKDEASLAEALGLAEAAAASTARMQGAEAAATLQRQGEVARVHARAGRCPEALDIYRRMWNVGVRRFGTGDRDILLYGSQLAAMEMRCGDKRAGSALQDQVLQAFESHFPDEPLTQSTRYGMATRLIGEARYREALRLLDRIDAKKMAAAMSSPAAKHWIDVQRGRCLIGMGDKGGGRELIAAALEEMVAMGIDRDAPGLVQARAYMED